MYERKSLKVELKKSKIGMKDIRNEVKICSYCRGVKKFSFISMLQYKIIICKLTLILHFYFKLRV